MKYLYPIVVNAIGVFSPTKKLNNQLTAVLIPAHSSPEMYWCDFRGVEKRDAEKAERVDEVVHEKIKKTEALRQLVYSGWEPRPARQIWQMDMLAAERSIRVRRPNRSTVKEQTMEPRIMTNWEEEAARMSAREAV